MKHRIALCVGLTALAVASATSASAQTYMEPPAAVPHPGYGAPPEPVVHDGMPPSEALMIARTSGLRPLTQPARQGPNWVLLASDNMGGQLRVVINARTGRIVHAAPAHDPRFAYSEPPARPRGLVPIAPSQHAAAPPSYGGALPPLHLNTPTPPPPRTAARPEPPPAARTARTPPPQTPPAPATQNSRLAGAPDTTGSVPSRPAARTPLPRPRPTIAANEGGAGAAPPTPPTQARQVVETSPEAEAASTPAPAAAAAAAPAKQAPAETQMVPVAPLD